MTQECLIVKTDLVLVHYKFYELVHLLGQDLRMPATQCETQIQSHILLYEQEGLVIGFVDGLELDVVVGQ